MSAEPLVGVIMGSTSDWEVMRHASETLERLGVPMPSRHLAGIDSLASIVQMPAGIPVGTLAIGQAGAINAALLATAILARSRPDLRAVLDRFRREQTEAVLALPDPRTA